jgi:hypothetical protein
MGVRRKVCSSNRRKQPEKSEKNQTRSGNSKCSAVFTFNPFGGFAATGPSLAGRWITVFRCDFDRGFGARRFGCAACRK